MIETGKTFGDTLRRLMREKGLSLREIETLAMMSKSKIHRLLNCSDGNVRDDDAEALDAILGSGVALADAARHDREKASAGALRGPNRYTGLALVVAHAGLGLPQGVSAMNRREFLQTGAVAAAVSLELTRHGLEGALAARSEVHADDWHEIVREHGFAYMTAPPQEMIEALTVDILALQYAVGDHDTSDVAQDLRRCGALLAALMATTVGNLGRLHETRRWWRTARTLADRSGDPTARAWVRGREVIRDLYEQRPVELILSKARTYVQELHDVSRPAMAELLAGRAQALALAGHTDDAKGCLSDFLAVCSAVPEDVIRDGESTFGWSTARQHFTESYVYSHTGDFALASAAQDAAVPLYPPTYLRGPAQIELQRALCMQRVGDSRAAAGHALTVLRSLPAADRIRPIVDLACRVDASIPVGDRNLPEVVAYRDFLPSARQFEAV